MEDGVLYSLGRTKLKGKIKERLSFDCALSIMIGIRETGS